GGVAVAVAGTLGIVGVGEAGFGDWQPVTIN
ncbi:MAG: hypothetical protein HW384_48, partial [Dehalococcoidia bacterium]|nr:hypothetical protein [Dehalococcoidia bacterium]